MPRKAQWPPPIYTRPNGQAWIRLRQNGRTRDITLGPAGSPEAKSAYLRIIAEHSAGTLPTAASEVDTAWTLTNAIALWLTEGVKRYRPVSTEPRNFKRPLTVLQRLYGTLPIAEFRQPQLQAVLAAMVSGSWLTDQERALIAKRKQSPGWCRNVVNRNRVRLLTFFKWCESQRLLPDGRYAALATVPHIQKGMPGVRHTSRPQAATQEQIDAILATLQVTRQHRPAAAMLELQWLTGCRSQDIRIMRYGDISRTGPIVDGVPLWLYRPRRDKNDWREQADAAPRVIVLGPACQVILKPWLRRSRHTDDFVFKPTPTQNRPYSESGYAQAVARAAKRAGLAKFHPYCCRHGAKNRIARLAGSDVARAQLGQSSIQTTAHYGELDQAAAAAFMARHG